MKKYTVYQTRNFEIGGDDRTHFIAEAETAEEAMKIAREKTSEKLCEIYVYQVETFAHGSKRVMVLWHGIRA